ncbi:hypothetical protein [Arenibacterium halophilum]|uniref:Uncharacterized protein n=1 Tax=Arenibacterium halophilum TaxID=2583821 RepID=A0ABY2XD84_9RHOB|nr:hypothetical protein [Arenibacterium halophilum]TMV13687.1 hypothetical protein FGK64_13250 [Arenibacterium halophilum]
MNLHIDTTTLPRMSGACLSANLSTSVEAFRSRPAPFMLKNETAKPLGDTQRSNLAGCGVSKVLPLNKSAGAEGQLSDVEPTGIFVERMLADPMIRLVMLADGVSEHEIRTLYRMRLPTKVHGRDRTYTSVLSVQEGAIPESGPRPGSPRPGIGE